MILCGPAPRHMYVANCLCRAARPVAIVQETGTRWTAKKLRRVLQPKQLLSKSSRWLHDRRRYAGNKEAIFFFENSAPRFERNDLAIQVAHVNEFKVAELADQQQPDVITVFGTSLIKPPLLGKGRLGMVNLHGGLSPEYRGADCTFWALYNSEPEKVGCTLHFIDAGIDTGQLIAHVCPEVRPGDDELTLFWRAVQYGAQVYADFLTRLEAGERFGQRQTKKGRLYRVKDRHWRHERALAKRLKRSPLLEEILPPRVEWFLSEVISQ